MAKQTIGVKSEPQPKSDDLADELEKASAEEEETSGKSTEEEAEPEEKEEETKEESFEEKLERLAQSKADKLSKTLHQKVSQLQTEKRTLEEQLNERVWDRSLQSLFKEDVEELGEDEAKKRQADRQKVAEQVKEYRLKKQEVDRMKTEFDDKVPRLNAIERDQQAKNDLWLLFFPDDKAKIDEVNKFLKKFEKANDIDEYDIILEGIKESVKAKSSKKPYKPDSSVEAGGEPDVSKMDIDQRLDLHLKQQRQKHKYI